MATQTSPQETEQTALAAAPRKPLLMERMAFQHGLDPVAFKAVLLKTVFPQDKQVSLEQLAMFCSVADKYGLNPLTREIYAFPSKGGGIIPILGIDGWITLIQRQKNYDGHEFLETWADGKVGGELLAVTCVIYRKDISRPVKMTEWMSECTRSTEQWKQKPVRMLTHKVFIQAARYAFGLSGIYDQDEAERILEAEVIQAGGMNNAPRPLVAMPQRREQPAITAAPTVIDIPQAAEAAPDPLEETADGAARTYFSGETFTGTSENLEAEPVGPETDVKMGPPIGRARAQKIHILRGKAKKRTESELFDKWLTPINLQHLADLPEEFEAAVIRWVEGQDD